MECLWFCMCEAAKSTQFILAVHQLWVSQNIVFVINWDFLKLGWTAGAAIKFELKLSVGRLPAPFSYSTALWVAMETAFLSFPHFYSSCLLFIPLFCLFTHIFHLKKAKKRKQVGIGGTCCVQVYLYWPFQRPRHWPDSSELILSPYSRSHCCHWQGETHLGSSDISAYNHQTSAGNVPSNTHNGELLTFCIYVPHNPSKVSSTRPSHAVLTGSSNDKESQNTSGILSPCISLCCKRWQCCMPLKITR